jgi:hypothetical protein
LFIRDIGLISTGVATSLPNHRHRCLCGIKSSINHHNPRTRTGQQQGSSTTITNTIVRGATANHASHFLT